MSACNAKTRNGSKCKIAGMANGRCRMHGGKSTIKKNQFASKHNIYSKFMSDDEALIADQLDLDSLDSELRLTKIQLMRALEAQNKADEKDIDDYENLVEYVENELQPASTAAKSAKTYKKRDFHAEIDRLKARIESLTVKIDGLSHSKLDKRIKELEIAKRERESLDEKIESIEITVTQASK